MPGATLDHVSKTFTVSQSWLGTFLRCPSLAGRELRGEVPSSDSDATALGTAWHEYIEDRLLGVRPTLARKLAVDHFKGKFNRGEFELVQIKTWPTLEQRLRTLADTFEEQIYPQLEPVGLLEFSFACPVLTTTDGWDLVLKGTVDFVGDSGGMLDWKTAGRTGKGSTWDPNEVKFKIQADAYTYAANELGFADPTEFTYVVAEKGPRQMPVQWLTVEKGPNDWAWLEVLIEDALVCALADVWPVNHTSHLCSAKWCGAWDQCRGAVIARRSVTAQNV